MPPRHAATRCRGCPSRLGARVISPGTRGTRGYGAGGRTFFGQKKIKPTTLHPRRQPATRPCSHHAAPNPHKQTTPQNPHTRPTRAPRGHKPKKQRPHTHAHARGKKNSAIGTRTRVSWVKAKYDNSRVFSYRQKHTYTIAEQLSIGKNAALSCLRLVKRAADWLLFSEAGFVNRPSGKPVIRGLTRLPRVKSRYGWRIRKSSRARSRSSSHFES